MRPYVLMKCAMSLDGYIDNTTSDRLLLSNEKDFAAVQKVRANCDAILVGAETIRKDNPRLLLQKGNKHPKKVTITLSGNLDPNSQFFTTGDNEKIVYTTHSVSETLQKQLPNATIISSKQPITLRHVLEDLSTRGIRRLLVEGGSSINTQLLQEGLVDELQLSIAGFLVGEKDAPRFVQPGKFPWNADNRMRLRSVQMAGDMAVLTYVPS